jgi:hypothetical protein
MLEGITPAYYKFKITVSVHVKVYSTLKLLKMMEESTYQNGFGYVVIACQWHV